MSRFSGKCDFCDEIQIFGLEHILRSRVIVGDNPEPLRLTCLEDCIPYYPYIVICAAHDNASGRGVILLSEKSWVDLEEERYGHCAAHDYYRAALQKELGQAANKSTEVSCENPCESQPASQKNARQDLLHALIAASNSFHRMLEEHGYTVSYGLDSSKTGYIRRRSAPPHEAQNLGELSITWKLAT